MSDWDEDSFEGGSGSDGGFDDWEEEDAAREEDEAAAAAAKLKATEDREEEKRRKQEKKDRIAAMAGELEADQNDIVELDGMEEREYRDRLAEYDVELAYADTGCFANKPINAMHPSNGDEFAVMGEKIGACMKTFSETKFFGYAVNQLLIKSVGKLSLENTQELSKKLHVLVAEKTKAAKESAEKEKKKKDEYAEKGADDLVRGNVAREEDEGECRNDLKGDGEVDLDDFM